MDIKKKIEDLVARISKDNNLVEQFKKDPNKTIQSLIGDKISADHIDQLIKGVKAKVSADQAGEMIGKAKGFFKK